ncbi:hypothetical protein LguiA_030811 [Lonicera macranthoides]
MQNESVKAGFIGENSMVKVKKDVMCLGFIDGGLRTRTSMTLGGQQSENYRLEYDLSIPKSRKTQYTGADT